MYLNLNLKPMKKLFKLLFSLGCFLVLIHPIESTAQDTYGAALQFGFATASTASGNFGTHPLVAGLQIKFQKEIFQNWHLSVGLQTMNDGIGGAIGGAEKNQIVKSYYFGLNDGSLAGDSAFEIRNRKQYLKVAQLSIGGRYFFTRVKTLNPFLGASLAFMSARPVNKANEAAPLSNIDARLTNTSGAGYMLEGGFDILLSRSFSIVLEGQWYKPFGDAKFYRASKVEVTSNLQDGKIYLSGATIQKEALSFMNINIGLCFKLGLSKKK
jgi:hypothetical protein